MTSTSRHVGRVVRARPEEVYRFAAEVENLPRWAGGLASAPARRVGDHLEVQSPMGPVTVRFTPRNDLGVLDHDVTLPSGQTVTNPMRVMAHPEGSEVVFTVRRLDLTEEEFERDVSTVARDLDRLRELVEALVP